MDDLLTRLRTQAEWHSDGHGPLHKEAAAEIERLRAALTEIADMPPLRSFNPDGSPVIYDAEQKIARAALDFEQKETK